MPKLNSRYRVAMLGSTATGKTSMLAAMYDKFPEVVGARSGLMLVANAETSKRLTTLLGLLKRAAVGAAGSRVDTHSVLYNISHEEFFFRLEGAVAICVGNCLARSPVG
jgi:hypothetical protein